jgi:hypothetical protein
MSRKKLGFVIVATALISMIPFGWAQSLPAGNPAPSVVDTNTVGPPSIEGRVAPGVSWLGRDEFNLSLIVLLFGFVVLIFEYLLLRRSPVQPDGVLRVYAVTLILVGTLFIVTSGFDINNVAPAMGLFGTIAGYLIGSHKQRTQKEARDNEES